jgi:hypothetical protein
MRIPSTIRNALTIATVLSLSFLGSDLIAGPPGPVHQAPSSFYFTDLGSPGGETESGSTAAGWMIYTETFTGPFAGTIEFGGVDLSQGEPFTVDLTAVRQLRLRPGTLYENASEAPIEDIGAPGNGLEVTIGNQNPNVQTGEFFVRDAEYDSSGNIQSLAVDFIVYSSGNPLDLGFGSIRYLSTIPLSKPPLSLNKSLPASADFQFRQWQGTVTSFR